MPKTDQKTIRFADLIKKSGRPSVFTLWTDPKQSGSFMKAVKQNRILTLSQNPASKKKDFGHIGFHEEAHAMYLIFPKPLPSSPNTHVIGIKYDQFDQPATYDPVSKRQVKPAKPIARPTEKTFHVTVRRTATIEVSLNITARNKTTAKQQAREMIRKQSFEPEDAVVRDEIRGVD